MAVAECLTQCILWVVMGLTNLHDISHCKMLSGVKVCGEYTCSTKAGSLIEVSHVWREIKKADECVFGSNLEQIFPPTRYFKMSGSPPLPKFSCCFPAFPCLSSISRVHILSEQINGAFHHTSPLLTRWRVCRRCPCLLWRTVNTQRASAQSTADLN